MKIVTNLSGSFSAQIDAAMAKLPGMVSALAKEATLGLAGAVIQGGAMGPGTPVDTGAARNSWTAYPTGGSAKPFTPQRAPDQTGEAAMALARQAIKASAPNVVRFTLGSNCPYMVPLETGTSLQAPHGMVRVALANWQRIVSDAAARVRTPHA